MPKDITVAETVQPMRPRQYSGQQLDLIRRTVAADCTQDEFNLFIEVCKRVGLDPFRKQIYAVVYNKKNREKRKMSIITGIDGFRAVAARNRDYRPDDEEPVIVTDPDAKDPNTNPLGIVKCTVRPFKLGPDGNWFRIPGTAHWDEFVPLQEVWKDDPQSGRRRPTGEFAIPKTSNWRKMPHVMIAKCGESQALRKGWPEDLSGIYAPEEMEAVDVESTATETIENYKTEERLKAINHKKAVPIVWTVGDEVEFVPMGEFVDRCLEYFTQEDMPERLKWWLQTNSQGLRLFWAEHKGDAMEIKEASEKRVQWLENEAKRLESEADQRTDAERVELQGAAE